LFGAHQAFCRLTIEPCLDFFDRWNIDVDKVFICHPNMSLYDIVNRSINLNLGRTVLTVLCTNFVVVSLWLLGAPVLGDFALCMLIGFCISIPSTIFVANPMVMYMEKRIHAKDVAKAAGGNKNPTPKHA